MLTSITPLGEQGRNRSWKTTAIAYTVGSLLGGAVAGLAAGGLGRLVAGWLAPATRGYVVVAILAVVIMSELGWPALTPVGHRQVNEDWLDEFRGWVVGLGFGFQLGLGVVTIVTSLTIPATFLLAALTGSWQWGLAVGTTFGLARALPIMSTRRIDRPDRLAALHRRHDRIAGAVRLAAVLAALPVAAMAVTI